MVQLRIALPEASHEAPLYVRTSAPVSFGDGFYHEEWQGLDVFRWMRQTGTLTFAPDSEPRFLEVWVMSEFHDLSQTIEVTCGGSVDRVELVAGWAPLSLAVPAGADAMSFTVNKPFPREYYPTDTRELWIRMRPALLHRDGARHRHIQLQQLNSARNTREMFEGRAALESTPPSLGIDLYGVCNVKPPCVYCEWDHNKKLEGAHVDTPFTVDTLKEWGEFFDNSLSLVNCSIGEPFMMKNLDDLLEIFGNAGKQLEMTTNGQILTDRNIQRLLGRNIDLYISLDAGTPETYAKLRNQRFDAILHNLRRLIDAKGGPGGLPRVQLVFMPMRVNVHELDAFVRICADLRVDRLVLRPLNYSDGNALDWERGGYHYVYQNELLPFDELVLVSGRAAELCERLGVPLADQMNFGGSLGAEFDTLFEKGRREVAAQFAAASAPSTEHQAPAPSTKHHPPAPSTEHAAPAPSTLHPAPSTAVAAAPLPSLGSEGKPACTEPWKSLYILRRGVFPCCYGAEPVAPMDQYREAWNSTLIQDVRSELAAGRFHTYCLKSAACPIVRKSQEAHDMPASQAAYMRVRSLWTRFNRVTEGRAVKTLQAARLVASRTKYAVKHPIDAARRTARTVLGPADATNRSRPAGRK
jgi:pyruvate-formate lyase-activating enzyme